QRAEGTPGVTYFPYVESAAGDGKGLLRTLSQNAVGVVTDYFPCFFVPRMVAAAAKKLDVRLQSVDANGVMPLQATDRVYTTAASFRRFLHKTILDHILPLPERAPLAALSSMAHVLDVSITTRWPDADFAALLDDGGIARLPLALDVPAVSTQGGSHTGEARAARFIERRLATYSEDRNHPDAAGGSGLSPYLHFGHISAHEMVGDILQKEGWSHPGETPKATGKREGWWGLSAAAEAFFDELITWREVGYTFCHHRLADYYQFSSLPEWVQTTLNEHRDDPRPTLYTLDELDSAQTHDPIWNAAQNELRKTGRMHNYLRMLWAKKILEWSPSPEDALQVLIELNNRYALDGRNPNSYSGIFWTLGRFDRAWGPVRPIFGKIRFMSSDSTKRKLKLTKYLAKYG
ncbi:MAG: deoxyribodipyrimidine photolyase, partial [Myxococcota bacterium]|nr:deoxyribodipyrimidine photolyase [Myxococcota bacterium]